MTHYPVLRKILEKMSHEMATTWKKTISVPLDVFEIFKNSKNWNLLIVTEIDKSIKKTLKLWSKPVL